MMIKIMMACVCVICVYILFTIVMANRRDDNSDGGNQMQTNANEDDLSIVISALHGTLDSMERTLDTIIIDAQYGTGQLQAHTKILLEKMKKNNLSLEQEEILNKIQTLHDKANRVADKQTKAIELKDSEHYHKMSRINNDNTPDTDLRELQCPESEYKKSVSLLFVLNFSNQCFEELLNQTTPPCKISDLCYNIMTKTDARSTLERTHQILYLQLAKMSICRPSFLELAREKKEPNISEIENIICCKIMEDAEKGAQTPQRTYPQQDIFEEQISVCGTCGFRDFAKKEWLTKLLSWRSPKGCFPDVRRSPMWRTSKNRPQGASAAGKPDETAPVLRRQKRNDLLTKDMCSAHSTSVATGALAFFLRVFVEDIIE